MDTIDKTGTYRNLDGDQFFYEEGAPVTHAQKAELELVDAGPTQTDNQRRQAEIAEKRTEMNAAPENKALVTAPQNRGRARDANGGDAGDKGK